MERVGVELQALGARTFNRDLDGAARRVDGVGDAARRTRGPLSLFNRDLDNTTRRSKLARTAVRGLGLGIAGIAVGVGAAGVAAFRQISQGFEGMAAQESAAAQVRAGIKSTGNAANVSAKRLGAYADRMERLTGIEYEQVQAAQATLLTFTKVRNGQAKGNKVFDRAIGLSADLATRFGGDLKKSALQVGKALNDPIKGISALGRVGVAFTEQQKEQIKALVESGQTMKAQKIILRELALEVGGSARAQGKTWDGLKARVGSAWGNIQESMAGAIAPLIRKWLPDLQRKFNEWAEWITEHRGDIRRFVKDGFERLKTAAQAVSDWWHRNGEDVKNGLRRIGEICQRFAPYVDEMVVAYLGFKAVGGATSKIRLAAEAMGLLKVAIGTKGGTGLWATLAGFTPIMAGAAVAAFAFWRAWEHGQAASGPGSGRSAEGQLDHVQNLIDNPGGKGAPKQPSPHAEADAFADPQKRLRTHAFNARFAGSGVAVNIGTIVQQPGQSGEALARLIGSEVAQKVARR